MYNKTFKRRLFSLFVILSLFLTMISANAHGGKTDAAGGHRDNQNKSGLGYYHYHCGGHPPHLHEDGVCPYKQSFAPKASSNNSVSSNQSVPESKEKSEKVAALFDDKPYSITNTDKQETNTSLEQAKKEESDQPLILKILKWIFSGLWILWIIGIVGTILMSIIEYIAESRGCLITVLVCIGLIIIYIVYKIIST